MLKLNQTENKGQQPSKQTPLEDKTMVLDSRNEESLGPRFRRFHASTALLKSVRTVFLSEISAPPIPFT
jgi:hypothetical protein